MALVFSLDAANREHLQQQVSTARVALGVGLFILALWTGLLIYGYFAFHTIRFLTYQGGLYFWIGIAFVAFMLWIYLARTSPWPSEVRVDFEGVTFVRSAGRQKHLQWAQSGVILRLRDSSQLDIARSCVPESAWYRFQLSDHSLPFYLTPDAFAAIMTIAQTAGARTIRRPPTEPDLLSERVDLVGPASRRGVEKSACRFG